MSIPLRYVVHQGPVIGALARGAIAAVASKGAKTDIPGPWIEKTIPALPGDLLDTYIRHVGGDPSGYRGQVPPHLFPQWVFPLQARALEGVSYPMQKVLNAGARMVIRGPLPRGEKLRVRTRLDEVDDDGRRALLRFVAFTGTEAEPELLEAQLNAFVPLAGPKSPKSAKKKSDRARVPAGAREIARWKLRADAGLDFAKLTGDFNPVHWVPRWARMMGFGNVILHGFSTYARTFEALVRARFSGATDRIRFFDARFTRPLVLPAKPAVYLDGEDVSVGLATSAPAFMTGTYRSSID